MKILLDTRILLWALSNDVKLPEKARKLIENAENEIYYSIISLWEVELKHLAQPAIMPISAKKISNYCILSRFHMIPIKKHIFAMQNLKCEKEALPHKDPFDRLLICQASTENMLLLRMTPLFLAITNLLFYWYDFDIFYYRKANPSNWNSPFFSFS